VHWLVKEMYDRLKMHGMNNINRVAYRKNQIDINNTLESTTLKFSESQVRKLIANQFNTYPYQRSPH
jgi:hypothetical protein